MNDENDALATDCPDKCKQCMPYAPYDDCCAIQCGEHDYCENCNSASRVYNNKITEGSKNE